MEIKNLNSSMIKAYKSASATKVSKESTDGAKKTSGLNKDKIEFDFSSSLSAAKMNAATEVRESASPERIASLRAAYAGDNCPVNSSELAESILN